VKAWIPLTGPASGSVTGPLTAGVGNGKKANVTTEGLKAS